MARLFFVTICILLSLLALAQPPKQYSFTHYTTSSGLLSNQVNTVLQDEDGYIWTGTTDGLQRFDGIRYKTFRHKENDSTSLPSNPVWQLLIDKKKNLWVLMADGKVGIFDTKKYTFHEITAHFKKAVTPKTSLKRLIADEYGHLFYLLSGSEVITLNEKATEFSYKNNFVKQKDDWEINDLIQEPGTKKYWISVANKGLAVYNQTTGNLSDKDANKENEPLIEYCGGRGSYYLLYFDRQHRLWSISWTTVPLIQCYNLPAAKPVLKDLTVGGYIKNYHDIKSFMQQQDGTVWVNGSLVFGKYDETKKQFQLVYNGYVNEQSIAYEMVHCLFEDREKNIWVATDNNGLYRFNPASQFFNTIKHINHLNLTPGEGSPMSFVKTKWGTVLAGTWGDGLYEYDTNFNEVPLSIKGLGKKINPFAWCMYASADSNTIWMAAQPGVYRIDQGKKMYTYFNPPVLKNVTVTQIAEDKKGDLWMGMYTSGIFKWTATKGKNNFEDGVIAITDVPKVQINKITIDSKGLVWVGTP
ncbi:MAG: two-component regulator propeller domain-containing protein, partial [Ferruginibacter sp.]